MARGKSGRVVIEMDPAAKEELYTALIKDGLTLKGWFLSRTSEYMRERNQRPLFPPSALAEGFTKEQEPRSSPRRKAKDSAKISKEQRS